MASEGASPVRLSEMTVNLGVSGSTFRVRPFLNAGPPQPPPWEPTQMPPLVTAAVAPGNPLVLLPFPMMPLRAGAAGKGPRDPGPCQVTIQVSPDVGLVESAQKQPVTRTQAPLSRSVTEHRSTTSGGAGCPAALCLASSALKTIMPATAARVTQAGTGSHPPHTPQPAAQVAPVLPPPSNGPQPQGGCQESVPGPARPQAPPDDSYSPKSVYENFRRWQLLKALTRRYLPRTPDTEALSCFLIPVLRTLARLKPSMSLEEGLRRALREWRGQSNFDRMIYYDMAAKFMEFETEEELEAQKPQWINGVQGLPPPTPRPEPQGAPCPQLGQQPVSVSKNAAPGARAAHPKSHKLQRPPKTKAPKEIPAEAVQEYVDIMEQLLRAPGTALRAALGACTEGTKGQQEEAGTGPEPGLLSYMDELCSQEAFVTKVEAVIHPSFLAQLLSPEPQLDLSALAEELEEEEGLTPMQLVEKRLRALQVTGARPQCHVPPKDSSPAESAAAHGAPTPARGHRPGASTDSCPPDTDCGDAPRPGQAEATTGTPDAFAPSPGCPGSPPLRASQSPCPQHTVPTLDSRAPRTQEEAPPSRGLSGQAKGSSEEEEELPSLAFLLASHHSLLPWDLPLSPSPDTDLCLPGGQGAPQPPLTHRRAFKPAAPAAALSRKRPLCPRPSTAGKTPVHRVSVELLGPSLPPKRSFQPAGAQRRRKRHSSQ